MELAETEAGREPSQRADDLGCRIRCCAGTWARRNQQPARLQQAPTPATAGWAVQDALQSRRTSCASAGRELRETRAQTQRLLPGAGRGSSPGSRPGCTQGRGPAPAAGRAGRGARRPESRQRERSAGPAAPSHMHRGAGPPILITGNPNEAKTNLARARLKTSKITKQAACRNQKTETPPCKTKTILRQTHANTKLPQPNCKHKAQEAADHADSCAPPPIKRWTRTRRGRGRADPRHGHGTLGGPSRLQEGLPCRSREGSRQARDAAAKGSSPGRQNRTTRTLAHMHARSGSPLAGRGATRSQAAAGAGAEQLGRRPRRGRKRIDRRGEAARQTKLLRTPMP